MPDTDDARKRISVSPTGLSNLPLEVFSQICTSLSLLDVLFLRRTCRNLRTQTEAVLRADAGCEVLAAVLSIPVTHVCARSLPAWQLLHGTYLRRLDSFVALRVVQMLSPAAVYNIWLSPEGLNARRDRELLQALLHTRLFTVPYTLEDPETDATELLYDFRRVGELELLFSALPGAPLVEVADHLDGWFRAISQVMLVMLDTQQLTPAQLQLRDKLVCDYTSAARVIFRQSTEHIHAMIASLWILTHVSELGNNVAIGPYIWQRTLLELIQSGTLGGGDKDWDDIVYDLEYSLDEYTLTGEAWCVYHQRLGEFDEDDENADLEEAWIEQSGIAEELDEDFDRAVRALDEMIQSKKD